jgi:hypothetical protein
MARFYKTASANPLDYMYKQNTPLMEKVLLQNDAYITENLQQADKLTTAATSFNYLEPDTNRAKEISDSYAEQIDSLTDAIRKDPANWRSQIAPIRDLSRRLQADYATGEISKISGNYNKYKTVSDYIDKEVENYSKTGKGISADRAKAYKESFLNSFVKANPKGTSYNPDTGEYNILNASNPMSNIDVQKLLSEGLDKLKADKKHYYKDEVSGDEWYFNTKENKWEGITPDKILGIVTDRLNNPQLMDYLRQDQNVGLISGVFDDKGNLINPYRYNTVPPSAEETQKVKTLQNYIASTKDPNTKAQLQETLADYTKELANRSELNWNPNSYLSPIMRGVVDQYSYSQTDVLDKLRNNSKGSTKYVQGQTNYRQFLNLAQQKQLAADREKGVNDRFDRTMEWNKYKWDNPQPKAGAKVSVSSSNPTVPGTVNTPDENGVIKMATKSLESWMTNANGQSVKVLSNEGLSADIEKLKNNLSVANTESAKIDKQMRGMLVNRILE